MNRARLTLALAAAASAGLVALASPASAATTVAQWNMGDSGTTMSDATGRGHTGTLHNVTVRQPGASGYGFGFSRTPAWVSVPASADFTPGTGNLAVSMSLKFSKRPAVDYDLIRMGLSTTAGGDWKAEILSNGRAYCLFRGSNGNVEVTGGPNLATNTWHRVTCARSGSSVVLTVDGTSYRTAKNPGNITAKTTVYIGAKDGSGVDQYVGLMDNVTVSKG